MLLIEDLEFVEVHEQQSQTGAFPSAYRQRLLESVQEQGPVR